MKPDFSKGRRGLYGGRMAVEPGGCADDSWSAKDDTRLWRRGFIFITSTALTRRPSPG